MQQRVVWLLLLSATLLVGCGTMDRRSISTSFDDERIESQVISQINANHTGIVHVNVTSFNRRVLLTGEVPSEASKAEIERIVTSVPNILSLNNELVVGQIEGIASRSADSLITSEVKLRFMSNGSFRSGRVKVVTENSIVYLMGLVYRKEADSAAYLASTTKGVARVVTMFEYLD